MPPDSHTDSPRTPFTPVEMDNRQPIPVPYLQDIPAVVTLAPGRQLFVDDTLIDSGKTTMAQVFHHPVKYPANPVLLPQSAEETSAEFPPCAIAKSGGVWFDDRDGLFKMWYMTGYLGYAALATSTDGIHWERPLLDVVPGTNLILPRGIHPDSGSVVIDHEAIGDEPRYKMLLREPDRPDVDNSRARAYTSPDGVHWSECGRTGPMHDRSTMFYNPFARKWVQSIRNANPTIGRMREYFDGDTFQESTRWEKGQPIPWQRADCLDHGKFTPAQLYNFDAIAYESLMIGFHQILHGPDNYIGERTGLPKLTELYLGSSRDGTHWHRPDREPFIGARREYGSWEYGYVESSAGMCCIVGDELWFYYSAYAGDPDRITKDWRLNGTYANGAVGLAKLRRDGFVSLRPIFPGSAIQTRRLAFSGSRLFVNADTACSRLTVAVLNADANPIAGLAHEDCLGLLGNSTCAEIRWKSRSLEGLGDAGVCFQFKMARGDLYAFWTTDSAEGKSGGYTAAGGPGLAGGRDL
ncbi:MAG: glycosyl hydrolase family 32 [Verrucomicrobiota bacterium JB024]|nr:glycosyl hydrolase family 32 [Verrucomicrobiota bacterium JB024]